VTGVSVMPFANLPRVLPVQGATTTTSSRFWGPMGSAPSMVRMGGLPAAFSARWSHWDAGPKRVSVEAAKVEKMGYRSYPFSPSFSSWGITWPNVQKDPQKAKPTLIRWFSILSPSFRDDIQDGVL